MLLLLLLLLLLWRTRVADWLTNQLAVLVALIITFKSPVLRLYSGRRCDTRSKETEHVKLPAIR